MRTLPSRKESPSGSLHEFPKGLNLRYQIVARPLLNWWYNFNSRWHDCQRCPLSAHRTKVIHFRGIIPAQVCFIGEAPGESENELGRPFVGDAGKLLDRLIDAAGLQDGDYCIINTVGCLPWDTERQTFRPPAKPEIKKCSPRLQELVEHINPSLIVLLGQVAANSVPQSSAEIIRLVHPSFINRTGEKPLDVKRFVLTLQRAWEKLNS